MAANSIQQPHRVYLQGLHPDNSGSHFRRKRDIRRFNLGQHLDGPHPSMYEEAPAHRLPSPEPYPKALRSTRLARNPTDGSKLPIRAPPHTCPENTSKPPDHRPTQSPLQIQERTIHQPKRRLSWSIAPSTYVRPRTHRHPSWKR